MLTCEAPLGKKKEPKEVTQEERVEEDEKNASSTPYVRRKPRRRLSGKKKKTASFLGRGNGMGKKGRKAQLDYRNLGGYYIFSVPFFFGGGLLREWRP